MVHSFYIFYMIWYKSLNFSYFDSNIKPGENLVVGVLYEKLGRRVCVRKHINITEKKDSQKALMLVIKIFSLNYWQEDISSIFKKADKDSSGTLTVKEFQETLDDICDRYPQVKLYLKNKNMSSLVDLLKESKGDAAKEFNVEEFKTALSQVDSQMKNLPATAQVYTL